MAVLPAFMLFISFYSSTLTFTNAALQSEKRTTTVLNPVTVTVFSETKRDLS